MATPEAALTQLVAVTLLAPVPETHHAFTPAIRTFHRMEDCKKQRDARLDTRQKGIGGEKTLALKCQLAVSSSVAQ